MELTEPIESINQQLIDLFGIDTITGDSMWRVVWSDTQTEKRLTKYTDLGIELLRPEVRELPKYSYIPHKYILENLVLIPVQNMPELPASKISYEPIFVFETKVGEPLPPRLDVCKFVIDTIFAAKGKSNLAKYKEPENAFAKNVDRTYAEFFGDETDVSDALAHREGVVVPSKFFGES
jgi:hypothetical protein